MIEYDHSYVRGFRKQAEGKKYLFYEKRQMIPCNLPVSGDAK